MKAMKRISLIIIAVALGWLACSGQPISKPAVHDPVRLPRIGQRVEVAGVALTVTDADNYAGKVAALVVIENVDREKMPYNLLYFKAKDAEGFEHNVSIMGKDPGLSSGTLMAGENVKGWVTFEAELSDGIVISYEPIVLLGGYEPIRIELSR